MNILHCQKSAVAATLSLHCFYMKQLVYYEWIIFIDESKNTLYKRWSDYAVTYADF